MIAAARRELEPAVVAPPADWQPVRSIAILPPDDWTATAVLDYITWYRALVETHLRARGWMVVPIGTVNRALNEWGFRMAGEVAQFSAEELAARMGCDAILSWAIQEASGEDVELNFSLIRKDGMTLWATGERKLRLPYKLYGSTPLRPGDQFMSLAIAEALKDFPAKQ